MTKNTSISEKIEAGRIYSREYMRRKRAAMAAQGLTARGTPRLLLAPPQTDEERRAKAKARYDNDPVYRQQCKARELQKRTGWTVEEKHLAFDLQAGRCAICGNNLGSVEKAHADHCHSSLKKRDLLCRPCNQLIGCAFDKTDILESAIEYLRKHHGQ